MDLELSEQIFGKDRSEQSYGLQALKLAAYTMDTCTKNKPKSLVLKN